MNTAALLVFGAALAIGSTVAAAIVEIDGAATVSEPAERLDSITINPEPEPTARYRVTFDVTWGPQTHPGTLPPGSHTSPAVVIVHSEPGDLFSMGTNASPGIEAMAEVGSTATLVGELSGDTSVDAFETGRRIDGTGVDSWEFELDQQHALVSLVSMLAPSPDWFVGVDGVPLLVDDGWVDRVELPLGSYDAGTDSGADFVSPDADTAPAQPIAGPREAAFAAAAAEGPFARIAIERIG